MFSQNVQAVRLVRLFCLFNQWLKNSPNKTFNSFQLYSFCPNEWIATNKSNNNKDMALVNLTLTYEFMFMSPPQNKIKTKNKNVSL